jgi:hypothetical protein
MTAVEWFAKELYEKFEMKGDGKVFDDLLNQSNKLFENQIKDAWNDGLWGKLREGEDNAESYYNETFKQQEQ